MASQQLISTDLEIRIDRIKPRPLAKIATLSYLVCSKMGSYRQRLIVYDHHLDKTLDTYSATLALIR